ncbi:cytochrome b [Shimia sediminis]|uniref:cytochrome b n=1 Tax=Shimia sediminis TaxID=2497945 RepID=UPI000F8E2527|nr:cytochrome b/b6 domain-containing protein [Shimia sediminis]
MQRFHPSVVTLHWVMALLIIIALLSGGYVPLNFHLISGLVISALLVLRVVSRATTRKVQPPAGQGGLMTKAAHWMHLGLYGLVAVVVATGLGMAVQGNLFQVALGGGPLPVGFAESALHKAHALATQLLLIAVAGHALAALWHQFIRRDHLFSRMWFARGRDRNAINNSHA